ncbi:MULTISPECIES: RluA family pseudouridine synthase [unclassified Arsukibacterium]|uniref:RluA family pseudouridine synthase n=1 Tax=unclassified Arsukibacterium TaxID=2635278 RepID=UPI000C61DDB9|nr:MULTISPECIES: RluA family pseudouridine synthase [unclassified Arsukibacterium]MAA95621.1 RNA pseudouridine synthase [Rheinheimera sp.]MBM33211.1 RNA pseudouridine synthase [Rheinheimera sp.]HAW92592.1 RNA pseudouridine synthase [Candidatus Azambacteria bacterium]|tara:strand:+ start:81 stop:737 length:657 start_codon:yes stop_codon:yes gene_type:complete
MNPFHYQPPLTPYLDIIYQDDDILVVNKPSGLLSVRGKAQEHWDCLEYRVKLVLPTARIVHRLDMATSGVMVLALNADAQRQLNRQFQLRQTEKNYIARVTGRVAADQGTICLPLICDWPNRPKQMVCYQRGKASVTHYQVLERSANVSRVQLTPVTGRSHQLRVHMQMIGHAILGDKFYADPKAFAAAERLQLHAQTLSLQHPANGKTLIFAVNCSF